MIAEAIMALTGAALMTASPIQRTIAFRKAARIDPDTLAGIGAALVIAETAADPVPDEWTALLGRLSDPEPPASRYGEAYDI